MVNAKVLAGKLAALLPFKVSIEGHMSHELLVLPDGRAVVASPDVKVITKLPELPAGVYTLTDLHSRLNAIGDTEIKLSAKDGYTRIAFGTRNSAKIDRSAVDMFQDGADLEHYLTMPSLHCVEGHSADDLFDSVIVSTAASNKEAPDAFDSSALPEGRGTYFRVQEGHFRSFASDAYDTMIVSERMPITPGTEGVINALNRKGIPAKAVLGLQAFTSKNPEARSSIGVYENQQTWLSFGFTESRIIVALTPEADEGAFFDTISEQALIDLHARAVTIPSDLRNTQRFTLVKGPNTEDPLDSLPSVVVTHEVLQFQTQYASLEYACEGPLSTTPFNGVAVDLSSLGKLVKNSTWHNLAVIPQAIFLCADRPTGAFALVRMGAKSHG